MIPMFPLLMVPHVRRNDKRHQDRSRRLSDVEDVVASSTQGPTHTPVGQPIGVEGGSLHSTAGEDQSKLWEACQRRLCDFVHWAAFPLASCLGLMINFCIFLSLFCFDVKWHSTLAFNFVLPRLEIRPDVCMSNIIFFEHVANKFLVLDMRCNEGNAVRMWPRLLSLCYPFLAAKHLTECLVILAIRAVTNQVRPDSQDFMDVFAGSANLSLLMLRANFSGSAFDLLFHSDHDALTSKGLRLLLDSMSSLRRRGLFWMGTKCSSWVVLCRYQSNRYPSNGFMGDESRAFVRNGNCLMTVSALMFLLAHMVGLLPVLEQPTSSVMVDCPSMRTVLDFCKAKRAITYMGQFSGPSQKPLQLWSPWGKIALLERPRPVDMVSLPLVERHGEHLRQFTGSKGLLTASEAYTTEFGKAVAEICRAEWSA